MKCLLDTHIFLWMYVSIVSLWEMQIKRQLGKLAMDVPLHELWHQQQMQSELLLLLTKEEHVWELGKLPPLHRDPFDRLLIAQARYEQVVLISADSMMPEYDTTVMW